MGVCVLFFCVLLCVLLFVYVLCLFSLLIVHCSLFDMLVFRVEAPSGAAVGVSIAARVQRSGRAERQTEAVEGVQGHEQEGGHAHCQGSAL